MDNLTIRQGAKLDFTVYQADPSSISATFTATMGAIMIQETVVYTDGKAHFTIQSPDTDVVGVYEYQVAENFATGSPDIYPNMAGCKDCSFPTLEICESLTGDGS